PLTVNTVLHRENLDRAGEVIALAEELHADRLELANTQYLGWALLNRQTLLPTPAQIESARSVAVAARKRLEGRMEVVFVVPDYYVEFPPACMDGWGRRCQAFHLTGNAGATDPACSLSPDHALVEAARADAARAAPRLVSFKYRSARAPAAG